VDHGVRAVPQVARSIGEGLGPSILGHRTNIPVVLA